MAATKDLDGAASPRAFFGAELRRMRIAAGLTQEGLGAKIYVSGAYVGQIEATTRSPNQELAVRLDTALGGEGHFVRLYEMVERSREHPPFFASFAELEKTAVKIESFEAQLVPGLLQTAAYARETFRAVWPYTPEERIEEMVAARLSRAELLKDPTGVELWAILDEAVIRRPGLDPTMMREQLEHIADLVRSRRIVVQVLPYSVGMHALMVGSLRLLSFENAPVVAYTEGPHSGQLLDSPEAIRACRLSYDQARAAALPPGASLTLIESATEGLKS
ncbi:helix-turn-helix domain-containing protein [Peterkaempfera sp. SMS 1(5)a]|uniref:helix-turn-helix domain-containing protein n=1 Tax=Peterkaempfera podocarpi TaxID=3232308 RepID=UPI003672C163